jgi:hypothetical protein
LRSLDRVAYCRLQTAEAEVQSIGVVQQRPWKVVPAWVPGTGSSLNVGTARVR